MKTTNGSNTNDKKVLNYYEYIIHILNHVDFKQATKAPKTSNNTQQQDPITTSNKIQQQHPQNPATATKGNKMKTPP